MTSTALRITTLAGLALAAGLLLAPGAAAGTARVLTEDVAVRGDPVGSEVLSRLSFTARPGERNRVRIKATARALVVTDRVPIQAGRGCRRRTLRTVRCAIVERAATISAALGDRSDSLVAGGRLRQTDDGTDEATRVSGGPGNDAIRLGKRPRDSGFAALVSGGSGDDRLNLARSGGVFTGGPGDDVMIGGPSLDTFLEGTRRNGSDTMVGGKQFSGFGDTVSYQRRRGGVTADLDGRRDDGASGERDRIGRDIERLLGGSGGDRLTGNRQRNDLFGGGGVDKLTGGGGNDTLGGGGAGDRLAGGSGRDLLQGGGDDVDTLLGGPDGDMLTARGGDLVNPGTGIDSVSAQRGPNRIDLRDGDRDDVFCTGDDPQAQLRLDALDSLFSTRRPGDGCAVSKREGEALALFRGGPGVNHFSGQAAALVSLSCSADADAPCSARVRIEMAGRVFDPVDYSGAINTRDDSVRVPIDPGAVRRLNNFGEVPGFLLISARTASGGTVKRRHPIVVGRESSKYGFGPID